MPRSARPTPHEESTVNLIQDMVARLESEGLATSRAQHLAERMIARYGKRHLREERRNDWR